MTITEEERGLVQTETDWIRPVVEAVFDFVRLQHLVTYRVKGDPNRTKTVEKDILQIFATRERPYAIQVQDLVRSGKLKRTGQLPMPVIAVQLADIIPDPSRYVGGDLRVQFTSDKRQLFLNEYPQPHNFIFQVDIRTRWKEGTSQMWSLLQQFQTKFKHSAAYVEVDMGPLGKQIQRVEMEGPQDTSDLDVGDNKERALRRTYTLTVLSWLVKPLKRVRTIRSVTLEEFDAVTGESLGISELANAKECF